MLSARPNSTFQAPSFQSKVSTSKKAAIFSQFSTLNCFNSSDNRHFGSIVLPNSVSRSYRARKSRNGGRKWTSTLFNRSRIEASLTAEDNARIEEAPLPLQPSAPYSIKIPVGDRQVFVETGHIGRQASGAVTVTDGETIIYTTVCMADDPSEPSDFFPLWVNYQEKFSAAGRTRNCEIKSIAPYGIFVEISPGREGLCHISELSTSWLAKAEDAVKVGDTIDVKLIEVNGKGQLRLSRRALLPDSNTENSGTNQRTVDLSEERTEKGKQNSVTRCGS